MVQFPEVSCELAIASTMQLLRTTEPPDAFVTTSDVYAAAVIRAARQVGLRVPQDVMVTGFDNIEFSTVTTPSITTVDQPRIRMGLMACELLVEKISNPALPLSLIHISEPTRQAEISYAVFCLKKKKYTLD